MSVGTAERFWTRRLRWRLIGAWRWPLFIGLTVADALIVHALPPSGAQAKLIPALIIASFGNLFLIGAVAPWLARRLAVRAGRERAASEFPPANPGELVVDRIAAILLALATLGLVVAGLGNVKVVVAETNAKRQAGEAAQAFVNAHAPQEVRRNFEGTASTARLAPGYFRVCGSYDDRLRAFCMFVDTKPRPRTVRYDPETTPNRQRFSAP
ncbi:MAG: hypothetical protein NVSMB25_19480 [Thermoleophilaceae bacterium]